MRLKEARGSDGGSLASYQIFRRHQPFSISHVEDRPVLGPCCPGHILGFEDRQCAAWTHNGKLLP